LEHKDNVIIFAPQSAVTPQAALLGIVARVLQDLGDDVKIVFCDNIFVYCPAMRCFGLSPDSSQEEREIISQKCLQAAIDVSNRYGISDSIILDSRSESESILECQKIMDHHEESGKDWLNFSYDGFAIGKCASYDATLSRKSLKLESDPDCKKTFIDSIRDSLLSYLVIKNLTQRLKPSVFVYYNDYSILHAAAKAAENSNNTRSICIAHASHRNVDFRKINIFKGGTMAQTLNLSERWLSWKDLTLTPDMVEEVQADIVQRLSGKGSHVFSTGIGHKFDLPIKSNIVLVAFTSSPDEVFAAFRLAESLGVKVPAPQYSFGTNHEDTQIEWLRALAAHCVNMGYTLIVRVHPREGVNRGGRESDHMKILREHLPHLPGSPFIVWPDDPTSSYDLAEAADLILTCWTSMAYELARMAVPAVTSSENVSLCPTSVFHPFTPNEKEYFELLEKKLREKPSFDTVKLAFRWWHLSALGGALDISDLVFTPNYSGHPDYKFPKESENLRNTIIRDGNSFDLNYERLIAVQTSSSEKEERAAILGALERVLRLLCFGNTDSEYDEPLELRFVSSSELDAFVPYSSNEVAGDGSDVVLLIEGSRVKRRSPLINRIMSLLLANHEEYKSS
jgi:hypothetical protein